MVAARGRDLDIRSRGKEIVERSAEARQRARAVARRSRGRSGVVEEMEAAMDEIALGRQGPPLRAEDRRLSGQYSLCPLITL